MDTEEEKLNEFIDNIHIGSCSLCGNNEWTMEKKVFELHEFEFAGTPLRTDLLSYPVVPIMCSKCGNTYFVNALKAGLIERPKESSLSHEKKCEQTDKL